MAARLSQLDFFVGNWRGELGTAVIEEAWSAPEGDNMTGMFRLVKDGEGVFYEFMTIEQTGDTPVLRIRHFSQGLAAWEEKGAVDPYPLVELAGERAVFRNEDSGTRLVYECPEPDRLRITLEKQKDGKPSAQVFSFRRSETSVVPPGRRDVLAAQVRETETAFARSMAERKFETFASFLAADCVFLSEGGTLRGRDAVAARWRTFFDGPDAPFSWEAGEIAVLDAGTLALSTGPVFDAAGVRIATFTSVWRLGSSGRWFIVFDKGDRFCNDNTKE